MSENLMDKIISLAKRRGFVFPGSDIYGGLANSWDYGPLGTELKRNIMDAWWKRFVTSRNDMVGLDAAIIMNPKVWEASGHLSEFTDPLVECKNCHTRFRVDNLVTNLEHLKSVQDEFLHQVDKNINEHKTIIQQVGSLHEVANQIIEKMKERPLNSEEAKNLIAAGQQILDIAKTKIDIGEEKGKFSRFLLDEIWKSQKFLGFVTQFYLNRHIFCPICKSSEWETPREFNLMFKTFIGPTEDASAVAYLRGELAQAMFVDFKLIQETSRKRLPFGIAQQGKCFRNEITPGNFIFRTREFNLMEFEYFVHPNEWEKHFESWLSEMKKWLDDCGVDPAHLYFHEIPDGERAHYSKRTVDIEYDYPFGRKELYGIAYRTDFDLQNHVKKSGADLTYTDPVTKEKFVPHVVEPTFGIDRTLLLVMLEAYREEEAPTAEEGESATRVVMKFPKRLAPYKIAVLPLSKKPELAAVAEPLAASLRRRWVVDYDETQSIGRRYRRQDEIGTPFCVTVDFDSLEDKKVTVRDRDSMKQDRVAIAEVEEYLRDKLTFDI